MSASIAEVLERAADLIERKGWTQNYYARGKSGNRVDTRAAATCFCALGAINVAAGGRPGDDYMPAIKVLEPLVVGAGNLDVPDWNDVPGRTQAEVVSKLREAAALARTQPDPVIDADQGEALSRAKQEMGDA